MHVMIRWKLAAGLMILVVILTDCASTFNFSWKNPEVDSTGIQKIAVYAISRNLAGRQVYEQEVVNLLVEKGYDAVPGLNYIPPNADPQNLDGNAIGRRLVRDGVDAVLTTAVVDRQTSTNYVPGSTYTVPGVPTNLARILPSHVSNST